MNINKKENKVIHSSLVLATGKHIKHSHKCSINGTVICNNTKSPSVHLFKHLDGFLKVYVVSFI